MKDQFVTYEIAKKLKELGFNEPCFATWEKNLKSPTMWEYWSIELRNSTNKEPEVEFTVPLWQQVIDWLRKEYEIIVTIRPFDKGKTFFFTLIDKEDTNHTSGTKEYQYEQAREAAILKALELIPPIQ